jgi:RNA recognition motif-containing protein
MMISEVKNPIGTPPLVQQPKQTHGASNQAKHQAKKPASARETKPQTTNTSKPTAPSAAPKTENVWLSRGPNPKVTQPLPTPNTATASAQSKQSTSNQQNRENQNNNSSKAPQHQRQQGKAPVASAPTTADSNVETPISNSILSNINQKLQNLNLHAASVNALSNSPAYDRRTQAQQPADHSQPSHQQQAQIPPTNGNGTHANQQGIHTGSTGFISSPFMTPHPLQHPLVLPTLIHPEQQFRGAPGGTVEEIEAQHMNQQQHQQQNNSVEEEEVPSRILWVGNISPEVNEIMLENEFSKYGVVESLRILHNRYCAFVNFEKEESATQAKQNLHGATVGGQNIVVNYRKADAGKPVGTIGGDSETIVLNKPSRALWIGNISNEVTEDDLWREFQVFGEIESVRLLRPKTCAFVNFMQLEDATHALHTLQGKLLGNMAIKINFGKPQLPPKKRESLQEYDFGSMNAAPGGYLPYMPNHPNAYGATGGYPLGAPNYAYLPGLDPYASLYVPTVPFICELCGMGYKEFAFAPCGHSCCGECVGKLRASLVLNSEKNAFCPYCREPIQKYLELSYTPSYAPMHPSMLGAIPSGGYPQTS